MNSALDDMKSFLRSCPPERWEEEWVRHRALNAVGKTPGFAALRARLLEIDGVEVMVPPSEPDLDKLLARGKEFPGRCFEHLLEEHRCHANVAYLWLTSQGRVRIVTGYGLSWEGRWHQHTFGLIDGGIIETTGEMARYFGVELTDTESLRFYASNQFALLDDADLLSRGWTKGLIRKFLRVPSFKTKNPLSHRGGRHPMLRLYDTHRVVEIEAMEAFRREAARPKVAAPRESLDWLGPLLQAGELDENA